MVFRDQIQVHNCIFAGPQPGFMMDEQISKFNALLTMETGSFEYEIGESRGQAAFGDLVFCPAGVSFKRKALSVVSFHHIQFEFASNADGLCAPHPLEGKISIRDTERLKSTFTYLRKLQNNRSSLIPQRHDRAQNRLVADLFLLCELEQLLPDITNRHLDPLMKKAIYYIHQQAFTTDISMQNIAHQLGLHPSRLTRRFQTVYGSTPATYLTKLRLDEAKRLLIETNDSLESIAYRCGYENGSYFCRIFTDKIGMNPSVFRHNNWI
jgi:AraC family transcriptional regulator